MYLFKEKNNLIYKLHPAAVMTLIGVMFILAMIFSHPFYLLGLFLAIGILITSSGNLENWTPYLNICLWMIVIVMLINTVFCQAGATILWRGPVLPGFGPLNIRMETLIYSAGMSLRLLVIISIFCFYTYGVNPDDMLGLFGKIGNRSMLTITLAMRLFPLMIQDFRRIMEVQRCRGLALDDSRWIQRIRNLLPVCSVLLLSSMERSIKLAESMHARGYGSGKRSNYSNNLWRPRDYLVLITAVFALITGVWTAISGWSVYSYYPVLEKSSPAQIVVAVVICLSLLMPAFLNKGWMCWPQLKSKI